MEAKETVMDETQVKGLFGGTWENASKLNIGIVIGAVSKAQAEISFKAGREAVLAEVKNGDVSVLDLIRAAKKDGIREVVEDLSNHLTVLFLVKARDGDTKGMDVCNHIKDRLQAKLEEWEA